MLLTYSLFIHICRRFKSSSLSAIPKNAWYVGLSKCILNDIFFSTFDVALTKSGSRETWNEGGGVYLCCWMAKARLAVCSSFLIWTWSCHFFLFAHLSLFCHYRRGVGKGSMWTLVEHGWVDPKYQGNSVLSMVVLANHRLAKGNHVNIREPRMWILYGNINEVGDIE